MVILSKYGIAAELLLNNTPDSTIIVNEEGIIVYVNQMTLNIFEFSREELSGEKIDILIPPRFHQQHPGHMTTFFNNSRSRAMGEGQKLYARRKDNSEFSVEISLSPIDTKFGKLVICSIRDVTERIKIQDALARSNTELEQFAYVASHDLQEPLRAVASFSQLLGNRYKGKLDQDADEFIDYIVDGANRMKNLINDLLSYSRLSSSEQPHTEINCNEILDEVIKNLHFPIEENLAKIHYTNLPTLNANSMQLIQLFQNLLSNAIKFKSDLAPEITITVEEQAEHYLFSINDNGIGIEPPYSEHIFTLFKRLNSRTEYSGTGIGLTLCKKIVELHGGKIWFKSIPQKGSSFFFTLTK